MGVEISLKEALAEQLQGGSFYNIDWYTFVQLCTKFDAFANFWPILLKSTITFIGITEMSAKRHEVNWKALTLEYKQNIVHAHIVII